MVYFNKIIKNNFGNLKNKNTKLSREVKKGNLIRIINGLYETNPNTPGYLLATSIYGPSYISFEYALSSYGLIPERVETITCATFSKKKNKIFHTPFGTFTYKDIPSLAYPKEIILKTESDYSYQIATPEKAICDKLYTLHPLKNYANLEQMLFQDLRIDEEKFTQLNPKIIEQLSTLYHSSNINLLANYLKRNEKNE